LIGDAPLGQKDNVTRAFQFQLPAWNLTGNWQLATGNWKLATGNWQLETGNWRLYL
jgi:hypothetical protein